MFSSVSDSTSWFIQFESACVSCTDSPLAVIVVKFNGSLSVTS